MSRLRVVLFDVDGVLLDSLKPHLKICEDKNKEYRLGLRIPPASEFRQLVRAGARISPMRYFFMAVGFSQKDAKRADLQYQRIFMRRYAPKRFPGVHKSLQALHKAGLQLGIVTLNVRANVIEALGPSIRFFHPDCIFSKDGTDGSSKAQSIVAAIKTLHARPAETIYVGDQPADWEAAKTAGVHFLGAAYGWGISTEDIEFPVAETVSEISQLVMSF